VIDIIVVVLKSIRGEIWGDDQYGWGVKLGYLPREACSTWDFRSFAARSRMSSCFDLSSMKIRVRASDEYEAIVSKRVLATSQDLLGRASLSGVELQLTHCVVGLAHHGIKSNVDKFCFQWL
jgi:hypothetical protein